ncbi:MAG: hypothetical protein L0G22_12425, partial [Propionibacteriaceae bacterium]|nr:hypothetical protein [Propionibacteriaceae bacterium]
MRILVVDAANVVGSVPDGWWKDRAGAARRLVERLDPDALGFDAAVVVLEGQARAGVPDPAADHGAVTVVHAPASGDDELVAQCRALASDHEVHRATADRGLIARVAPLGVTIVGPR